MSQSRAALEFIEARYRHLVNELRTDAALFPSWMQRTLGSSVAY